MRPGERQVSETLDGIRADHVNRYKWAVAQLNGEHNKVVDLGCGVGYGSDLLARAGHEVTGLDSDLEAVLYAKKHWSDGGAYFMGPDYHVEEADVVVAFEIIEHVADAPQLLRDIATVAPRLLVSVPNEDVLPFKGPGHENGYAYHYRHYTLDEFKDVLEATGWEITRFYGQQGTDSYPILWMEGQGRTLVADCQRKR